LNHAQEGLCILERQLALADVERAALGTEDEEAIESLPISHLPGEAAGAVADLVRAEDLLMLWSRAGLNPAENVCNSRHNVDRHLLSRGVVVKMRQVWARDCRLDLSRWSSRPAGGKRRRIREGGLRTHWVPKTNLLRHKCRSRA